MNWGMIGHEWAVKLLAEHVSRHSERHAYLFTGPSGIGRRTLALHFAQGLNCPTPSAPGEPCQACPTCRRIEQMQHPDLSVIEAEHEGETLKIDQVRSLQHTLSLTPFEARYRVALLLRFEEAHASAANALLKTLEEPPSRVVMLLTAKSGESLLPTIVSRCEVIRLRPVPLEQVSRGLQSQRNMQADQADLLAHLSDGRPGYAIRLFEQPGLMEQRKEGLDTLLRLLADSRRERFAFARQMADDKEELRLGLQNWLTFWRDVLVCASGIGRSITNLDYSAAVQVLADHTGLKGAQQQVRAVENTMEQIDRNVNPRLALEVLLMDFPKVNTGT